MELITLLVSLVGLFSIMYLCGAVTITFLLSVFNDISLGKALDQALSKPVSIGLFTFMWIAAYLI